MRNRNDRPKRPLTQKALQSFKLTLVGKTPRRRPVNPMFFRAQLGQFQGLPIQLN